MKPRLTKTVIGVDFDRLETYSRTLAERVQQSGFKPDVLLYVETAGLHVAYPMRSVFSCPVSGIVAKRKGQTLKADLKIVLRHLPRPLTHSLRTMELKSQIHRVNKNRQISCECEPFPADGHLLIVDDAVDTGYTLFQIHQYLWSQGIRTERIKTAALTQTLSDPIVKPDFVLFRNTILTFPWSCDSQQFSEAEYRYHVYKQTLDMPVNESFL
jgi:hypoxanthine phosphoribosyltransferase